MDECCVLCETPIIVSQPRYYVAFATREQHRESWEVLAVICARCFIAGKLRIQKEEG